MQRTYRSKKDTVGGLDHRDMLYNRDEKSSAFDAFYIENIKQTKREQSCMGASNNYGAAAKKVRKRKYVKRLVTSPKHSVRESLSGSVFLTPDKSLRVNKAPDPFDQLLNSSPVCPEDKQPTIMDHFDKMLAGTPKETKTYIRKKKMLKKFSTESSASDKENSMTTKNSTQNVTDVKAHELLIEKEAAPSTEIDDSINKIVKKLTLLNNMNLKNSSGSPKIIKCHKNRLTKNLQSPLLKTSPLSSTPFMDKTRSKSIYKFSPIPLDYDDSPKCMTIMEDDNDVNNSVEDDNIVNKSIVFVLKQNTSKKRSQKEESSLPKSSTQFKGDSNPLFSSEADSHDNISNNVAKLPVNKNPPNISGNKDLADPRHSYLQISEMEPFLGFSNESIATNKYLNNKDEEEKDYSIIIPMKNSSKNSQKSEKRCQNSHNEAKGNDSKEEPMDHADVFTSIEYSVQPEPFLGFSKQSDSINISAIDNSLPSQQHLGYPEDENEIKESENNSSKNCSDSSKSDNDSTKNEESEKQFNDSVDVSVPMVEINRILTTDSVEHLSQGRDSEKSLTDDSQNESVDEKSEELDDEYSGKHSLLSQHRDSQKSLSSDSQNESVDEKSEKLDDEYSDEHSLLSQSRDSEKSLSYDSQNESVDEKSEELDDEHSDKYSILSQGGDSEKSLSDDSQNESVDEKSEELDDEHSDKHSLYDTCCSASSSTKDIRHKEPVVALERMDIDTINKYQQVPSLYSEGPLVVIERLSKESLQKYDGKKQNPSELKVAVERMDKDLFKKYYENMPNSSEDEKVDSVAELSEDYASLEDSDYILDNDSDYIVVDDEHSEENTESTYAEPDKTSVSSDSDSCSHETISSDDKEISIKKEKCVSFVTTRRGKNLTKYSNIVVLDDSQESTGSECDKTVLSNHKNSPKEDVNNTIVGANDENIILDVEKTDLNEAGTSDTRLSNVVSRSRASNITVRNSKLFIESNSSDSMDTLDISKTAEPKPGIILQPGKKWERSLSIYRRMTMNDHCDHSLLEDEELQSKGRMYRQSVISTMEMQGSLHNDSIHSRRSTFVSKPSRSTIRIVKETNNSRLSLSSTAVFDDLKGFLEDCDDTIVELSKLSLVDDHDVTVIEKFHEDRIATARDYVLRRCNQSDTVPFDECYPDPLLKNCRKIGEGVYGEVFLWRAPDGRARVMKVVPIAGQVKVNGERQKDFHEIIAEIVIAMELSALRAPISEIECHFEGGKDVETLDLHSVENATDVFNEVLAVRCVYGSYSSRLLDLWELYDETKGSENDNPAILPADQQYIVLELANAGQDLESYQFTAADQAHALFLQVAYGLAVGEEAFQFEHRDLHWGNVLIAPSDQKFATFVLRGRAHRVARRGVAATIIDYSLSRLSLPLGVRERDADSAALYNDLSTDDGLFGAVGDYQFEVYRLMREKLGNDWKNFEPYTNILWLHYIADKMITALRYKRTATKCHKQYINKLKAIKQRILTYGSAVQFVLTDNEF